MKLTQLCNTVEKTKDVLDSNRREAIERQCAAPKSIVDNINHIPLVVEEKKIQDKVDLPDLQTWNTDLDDNLVEGDIEVERLWKWLEYHRKEQEMIAREKQINYTRRR